MLKLCLQVWQMTQASRRRRWVESPITSGKHGQTPAEAFANDRSLVQLYVSESEDTRVAVTMDRSSSENPKLALLAL